jgi:hypothetical protein
MYVLLQFNISLVRSKLDYECLFYEPARKVYFQTLDAIHNKGIRVCLAFSTSPIKASMLKKLNRH